MEGSAPNRWFCPANTAGLLAWALLLAFGAYQVTTIDAVEGWPGDAAVAAVGLGLVGAIFAADRRWSRHGHTRRP